MAIDLTNPDTPAWELLVVAQRAGVKYRAIAGTPARLFVWGATSPEADRVVDALYACRDEVVPLIPSTVAAHDGQPEMLVGELPLAVLKTLVVGWVHDTIEMIRSEEEWEHNIAGRDDPPPPPPQGRKGWIEL
jgi:hypothetical protein